MARKIIRPNLVQQALGGPALVDADAMVEAHLARWRAADPDIDLSSLHDALRALAPERRTEFAALIQALRSLESGGEAREEPLTKRQLAEKVLREALPSSLPQLVLALRDEHWYILEGATRILAESRVREAAPFLFSLLARPTPGDAYVFHHIAWALLAVFEELIVEQLGPNASSSSFAPCLPPAMERAVLALLEHPNGDIQAAIADALVMRSREEKHLRAVFDRLPAPATLRAACNACQVLRDPALQPRLEEVLSATRDPEQRAMLLAALARCGDVRPALAEFDALPEGLQGPLVTALFDTDDKSARAFLMARLEDDARPRGLRLDILARYSERRDRAVVNRFKHLYRDT
jgi:hypothetical protein